MDDDIIGLQIFSNEYYQNLGRFVSEFSEVEGIMVLAPWNLANVKTAIAQVIFSGVRTDDACNKITRLGMAQKWPDTKFAEWKTISDHLGWLRQFRNDILHYGAYWKDSDTWINSNKIFVTPGKVKNTPVTPAILNAAAADAKKLAIHIFVFLYGDVMSAAGKEKVKDILEGACLYKSPQ